MKLEFSSPSFIHPFAKSFSGAFGLTLTLFEQTTLPEQQFAIFVCSTTGQGEVPDSMKARALSSFQTAFADIRRLS